MPPQERRSVPGTSFGPILFLVAGGAACSSSDPSTEQAPSGAAASTLVPSAATTTSASGGPSGPASKSPSHVGALSWLAAHSHDARSPGTKTCGKDPRNPDWCEALCSPGNVLSCAVVYRESDPANARVGFEVPGFVDCGVVGVASDPTTPGTKDRTCTLSDPVLSEFKVRILHEEASSVLRMPDRSLIFVFYPGFAGRN